MLALIQSASRRIMPTLSWSWLGCGLMALLLLACQDEQTTRKRDVARSQILAEIGDALITKDDFQKALQQLSPFIRQQYKTPKRKAQFLEQLIQFELLVQEAKRKGYRQHSSVVRTRHKAMIALLIKKIVQASKVNNITAAELRRYYEAQRKQDPTLQTTPFQKLQQRLRKALRKRKQTQAYKAYIARLRASYTVKIDQTLLAQIKPLPAKAPKRRAAAPRPTTPQAPAPRPAQPAAPAPRATSQPMGPRPSPRPASRPSKTPQRVQPTPRLNAPAPQPRPSSRPAAPTPRSAASRPTSRRAQPTPRRPASRPVQ